VTHLTSLGCVECCEREARQDLVEEGLELLPAHASRELEPLDAGLRQTLRPVPRPELLERQVAEHDLVAEKGEERVGRGGLEVPELLERGVDGPLARRMTLRIERHGRERLCEGRQEADRIAHRGGTAAVAARRISASFDVVARSSTACTAGSEAHPAASAASDARSSGDLEARRSRPSKVRP